MQAEDESVKSFKNQTTNALISALISALTSVTVIIQGGAPYLLFTAPMQLDTLKAETDREKQRASRIEQQRIQANVLEEAFAAQQRDRDITVARFLLVQNKVPANSQPALMQKYLNDDSELKADIESLSSNPVLHDFLPAFRSWIDADDSTYKMLSVSRRFNKQDASAVKQNSQAIHEAQISAQVLLAKTTDLDKEFKDDVESEVRSKQASIDDLTRHLKVILFVLRVVTCTAVAVTLLKVASYVKKRFVPKRIMPNIEG